MKEINYNSATKMHSAPIIHKLGVVSENGEMTPVVRDGVLYRVETVSSYDPETMIFDGGFCVRNLESGECTAVFGERYHFFSAYCESGTLYVFGTNEQKNRGRGGDTISMFYSDDLINWQVYDIIHRPGWQIYNTSVCKSGDGYTLAYEAGAPRDKVGVPFTIFFAKSDNLFNWSLLDDEICYSRSRYTACPALRYLDEDRYYYMICLEELPLTRYAPYIYRSRDLVTWEIGLHNPILWISPEDRIPKPGSDFTPETVEKIQSYMNINNCDIDLCEYNGKTVINYLTGNQLGTFFMCEAVYDGSLRSFLQAHFE